MIEILLMNLWNKIVMTIGILCFVLICIGVIGCLLWVFFGDKKIKTKQQIKKVR